MAALKDLFQAEQQKVIDKVDNYRAEEEGFFNDKVAPVVNRIVATINKDPDLVAEYVIKGQQGRYFDESDATPGAYYWGIDIIVGDRQKDREMGRTHIRLVGEAPETVLVPDPKLSATTKVYKVDTNNADAVYNAIAENVVRVAGQNSVKQLERELFASPRFRRKPPF